MIFIALFFSSLFLTYIVREVYIRKAIMDIPNERSSHTIATPHGGGIAIMITFFVGISYLHVTNEIDASLFYALLSVLPITLVSFLDDMFEITAKTRLFIQALSAVSALFFLEGVSLLNLQVTELNSILINIFAFITIIWLTNLYNFLDGIDGYAGSEAIFVSVGAYLLFQNSVSLVIAFSVVGFLFFNWHKASIFMGDVGSASLGFIFAVLLFSDASTSNFVGWLVLLGLFWFDATYTLIRRYFNKEKLSSAHKKHMYQRFNQLGYSHAFVVLTAMLINSIFLVLLYLFPTSYFYLLLVMVGVYFLLVKILDKRRPFL